MPKVEVKLKRVRKVSAGASKEPEETSQASTRSIVSSLNPDPISGPVLLPSS